MEYFLNVPFFPIELWMPICFGCLLSHIHWQAQGGNNRNEYGQSNMDIIYHAFMKWLSSSSRASLWLSGQESACRCKRHGFSPWVWIPCRRKWQPTPVFLPGNPRGTWWATAHEISRVRHDLVTKQQQTMPLSLTCFVMDMHTHGYDYYMAYTVQLWFLLRKWWK